MDNSTRKELKRISANIPKKLQDGLVREEVDTSQEDILKQYVRDNRGKLSLEKAHELERVIASGRLRTKETVVDEGVAKEIEEYNELKVRRAKERGKLQDPEQDAWYKRRMEKMRRR